MGKRREEQACLTTINHPFAGSCKCQLFFIFHQNVSSADFSNLSMLQMIVLHRSKLVASVLSFSKNSE